MYNFQYYKPVSQLYQKLENFFPTNNFNQIMISKRFNNGICQIKVFRDNEGQYLANSSGKFQTPTLYSHYNVYSDKNYLGFARYRTESKGFGISASIASENLMNRSFYAIPSNIFSSANLKLKGENVSFKATASSCYDKTPVFNTLMRIGNSRLFSSVMFSDKQTKVVASLYTWFGLLLNAKCITKPFVLNSIEFGYLNKYKFLEFYTSMDALYQKANIVAIAKPINTVSLALHGKYDHLKNAGNLKAGIVIEKNAKLRASVDIHGYTDIDVTIDPKPWLQVKLNSKSNLIKAETAWFGYSLEFKV